ncbi:heavy metal translocating P-type ATPase [Thermodesulfovibrionales bacterium]|nr:heavy metal translocating P-type ATPase [Thermodesulfovibrionales bacterium]
MKFSIIHELSDRLKIKLSIPRGYSFDMDAINVIEGIRAVSVNQSIGTLLVRYDGDGSTRMDLTKAVAEIPLTSLQKNKPVCDKLRKKKMVAIKSGMLLLASPLIPLPLKPLIAFYGAMPIFKKGIQSLLNRHLNVDVLDSSAIGVAMGIGDYRAAGIISFLLKVGDYFEERIRQRSRKMLADMYQVVGGEYVWVNTEEGEVLVKASEISEGDVVIVRAGSLIPVDGTVIEGEAMVNQSSMTGEPLPVMKRAGITVYAGTAVVEGTLFIKTISARNETRVAKIIKVIEESENLKADAQSHAEELANEIVPYSLLLSGITYALTGSLVRTASVLLVDYSCILKLSAPLAIMSTITKAASRGVLIKGGKFIEKLSSADVFVFDKTGTLTQATPKVVDVIPFNGYEREYVLKYAACVEEHFPHPVATAIITKAADEGIIHKEEHGKVEYIAAHGIVSMVNGKRILVGSRHFILDDEGVDLGIAESTIKELAHRGLSVLYVAMDNELAGIIAIDDPLRQDSLKLLQELNGLGVRKVIMLTGDTDAAARSAAEKLGIKEYHSQMLPDEKREIINQLKDIGHVVAMVGDGINDSPALSIADVGISMKHGADVAKETCDVLILNEDLDGIVYARDVSQKTIALIKQNFKYIIGINSALIGLGLIGFLSPATSALMHNVTTIAVTMNSVRSLSVKREEGI